MRVDFADAVHGTEKEINIESGKVKVKIPQGIRDGTEMKFAGKGMPGPNGAPPGDLYINFRVSTPEEFQRVGDNLGTTVEIDFVQAALGDKVEVPVVDLNKKSGLGKTKLKIPQGTQPRTQFRLRGKGMPRLRGNGRGDVIVEVFVKIPKRLSKKQRELLERYKNL
jgi:molecular chaperone DnaJ